MFLTGLISLLEGQVCSLLGLDVLGLARALVCYNSLQHVGQRKAKEGIRTMGLCYGLFKS